jgi:hypothetical protein
VLDAVADDKSDDEDAVRSTAVFHLVAHQFSSRTMG